MGMAHAPRDAQQRPSGLSDREPSLALEPLLEVPPRRMVHNYVKASAVLPGRMNPKNVRVTVDSSLSLPLSAKASEQGLGGIGCKRLDREGTIVAGIDRRKDDAHAPASDLLSKAQFANLCPRLPRGCSHS
jgi:hypothetical protein